MNKIELTQKIKSLGLSLGFQQVGITDTNLTSFDQYLLDYLEKKHHGEMAYMEKHGLLRLRPEELVPGTKSIIVVRMNYLPPNQSMWELLKNKSKAYIARYALGRDYHNLIKKRLKKYAKQIEEIAGEHGHRAFVDSAPIMEKALAEKAGLGWTGKNTLILNKQAGSYFFLGVLLTNLELDFDQEDSQDHCGKCKACITVCPTQAIIAPYQLDASRCISYLTIEHKGTIPIEFRKPMGNRVFGCDDCQIMCPWNRYAKITDEQDFHPRHNFDDQKLIDLFLISEEKFNEITNGSPIKRTGYQGWLRNIAIALGNAEYDEKIIAALKQRLFEPNIIISDVVKEHIEWALDQHSAALPKNE